MNDKHLDDAIDRAVREMMSAEPRPGMRHRVLARIGTRPSRLLTLPRLATAAGFFIVALGLFFANRPTEQPPVTVAVQKPTPPTPTIPAMPAPVTPSVIFDAPRAPVQDERPLAGRVQAASLESEDPGEPFVQIEAIQVIEPITLSRVEQKQILTSEVTVKPITIEPIEIAPISTPR
jgi:hypothetical protein